MRTPPLADGAEITEGVLFRRIKPDDGYFLDGKATHEVFRPRAVDDGKLSTYLKDYVSVAEVASNHRAPNPDRYGVCEFDIGAARKATEGRIRVFYQRSSKPNGHAHFVVTGCDDEVSAILAQLAVTVRPPRL